MPVFVLRNKRDSGCYDTVFTMVVRASGPTQARRLASEEHQSEGAGLWLDKTRSSCKLADIGKKEVICKEYIAG